MAFVFGKQSDGGGHVRIPAAARTCHWQLVVNITGLSHSLHWVALTAGCLLFFPPLLPQSLREQRDRLLSSVHPKVSIV